MSNTTNISITKKITKSKTCGSAKRYFITIFHEYLASDNLAKFNFLTFLQ